MKAVFGDKYTEEDDKILAHKAGNPEESVQSAGEVRREAAASGTSRRRMLGLSGALGATVAGMGLLDATPAAAASTKVDTHKLLGRGRTLVDMSHTWGSDFPGFTPFVAPATFDQVATLDKEGYNTFMITMDEHSGTHMDCPKHFDNGAWSSDEIPAENLIAPLVVIRIAERAAKDPDALVTYRDLAKWESRHGRIPDGALVAMDSGWADRINDPERIYNRDAENIPHFPGFGWDASEFLESRRNVVGISVDSPSMDSGENNFKGAHTHKILLPTNHYGIEWAANTGRLPEAGAVAVVGLMKHRGGFAGPVRMFGIY
ncbi:cyclase family protein [Streptomyces sp. NPDC006458]|uniref:cyclase family protein n=1 Tax=Streptomyces sp. NPDC006458 TaxID=3154302 RepID=UPI0033B71DDA